MVTDNSIIFKSNISNDDINDIINEIKMIDGITYFSFSEFKKFKKLSIYDNNLFIGLICYNEYEKYIDFKICIIKKIYRNKGYTKLLINEFIKDNNKPILCASKNPIMINYLLKINFLRIKLYKLPIKFQISQCLMVFNIKRIKEYLRKIKTNNNKFEFFIKE